MYMTFGSSTYTCSGGIGGDEFHVLTAGHCIYDRDQSSFADEVYVYPGQVGVSVSSWEDWDTPCSYIDYDDNICVQRPYGRVRKKETKTSS